MGKMAIFWGNSGASPLEQRFRTQLDRIILLFLAIAARARAASTKRFSREQTRLGLWTPVAMGAGIGAYFAWPTEPEWRWALLALIVTVVAAFRLRQQNSISLLMLGLVACVLGFNAALLRTATVEAPRLHQEMRGVTLAGLVAEANRDESGGLSLIVAPTRIDRLEPHELPARLRLKVKQKDVVLWPGDVIETRALLWPPSEPVAPGAFDFGRQAFFQRLGGTGVTLSGPVVTMQAERSGLSLWIEQVRERVARHVIQSMGSETGPIAAALMTGQRRAIPDETVQDLRDSGLAHILAISGLHMVLFAGTLFWLLRAGLAAIPYLALRAPIKKWAAFAALLGALAYLLLSGSAVATQRAFIMTGLMFLAIMADRPAFSMRNVALAAIIVLLLRPESLLEPGFQMSFAAVTGLIAVYQNRELQLLRWKEKATGLSGLTRLALIYVATLAITSVVAGAATAPYAAFHFNRFASFGLVGNLLAMPLVGTIVMPAALIAFLLMPLGLDGPALWVMGFGIEGVLWAAHLVAGWQGATVEIAAMSDLSLVCITLGGLWLALWRTSLRLGGLAALALGLLLAAATPHPDILISGEGRLVAVRGADGQYVWSGRAPRYAAETWSRRNGEGPDALPRLNPMSCDLLGCVALTEGARVIVSYAAEGLSDDCDRADILIAHYPIRGKLRRQCGAQTIIDIFDTSRYGTHALQVQNGEVVNTQTVRALRGDRPWSVGPRR